MASTAWIVIAVVFVIGLLPLGISSAMLRSVREDSLGVQGAASWPRLVDESLEAAGPQLRLDMVERLAIVDSEWSRGVLERARAEERDPQVRSAIEIALGN